jgi:hypothetical protein
VGRSVGPLNLILAVLATLRLTRFITEDTLAHWMIVRPARVWATPRHALIGWTEGDGETPARPKIVVDHVWEDMDPGVEGWKVKLVSGLDCRWCVGFWLGAAVLLSLVIARAVPPVLPVWRFVMGALSINVAANAVGKWTGTLP